MRHGCPSVRRGGLRVKSRALTQVSATRSRIVSLVVCGASEQLGTDEPGGLDHRLHLEESYFRRQVFQSAIRRDDDSLRAHKWQGAPDTRGYSFGSLDFVRRKIEDAENDCLVRELC